MGIGMTLRQFKNTTDANWRNWRKKNSKDGTCVSASVGIGLTTYSQTDAQLTHPPIPAFELAQIFCRRALLRMADGRMVLRAAPCAD